MGNPRVGLMALGHGAHPLGCNDEAADYRFYL